MEVEAKCIVDLANAAYERGWGYVLGGQGNLYTEELAREWGRKRQGGMPPSYFTKTCARWFGKVVVDCSGLIVLAIQVKNSSYPDQASGTLFNRCTRTGRLATLPEIPGLLLWKPGHVGVYIGGGQAIEARGVAYGVVKTAVKGRGWTNWGMLRGVSYGRVFDIPATETETVYRLLKLTKPMQVGEDVRWLQQKLASNGSSCGSADGIFGSKTEGAVKVYQLANGLTVDGKAGRATVTALGGAYMA